MLRERSGAAARRDGAGRRERLGQVDGAGGARRRPRAERRGRLGGRPARHPAQRAGVAAPGGRAQPGRRPVGLLPARRDAARAVQLPRGQPEPPTARTRAFHELSHGEAFLSAALPPGLRRRALPARRAGRGAVVHRRRSRSITQLARRRRRRRPGAASRRTPPCSRRCPARGCWRSGPGASARPAGTSWSSPRTGGRSSTTRRRSSGTSPEGQSLGPSALVSRVGEQGGVPGQVQRPALVGADAAGHGLPAGAVPVEVAVLQLDPGAVRLLGDERTSTSLLLSGSVSTCQVGPMSQLNTTRSGGS